MELWEFGGEIMESRFVTCDWGFDWWLCPWTLWIQKKISKESGFFQGSDQQEVEILWSGFDMVNELIVGWFGTNSNNNRHLYIYNDNRLRARKWQVEHQYKYKRCSAYIMEMKCVQHIFEYSSVLDCSLFQTACNYMCHDTWSGIVLIMCLETLNWCNETVKKGARFNIHILWIGKC